MRERPILFSAPMVRSLLAGTKTQTRRVIKPRHLAFFNQDAAAMLNDWNERPLPYGKPGDRLAVRETFYAWGHWTKRYSEKKRREEWHFVDETMGTGKAYRYEADEKLPRRKRELHEVGWWKRPATFMPQAASRITLEITSVRVQRLQDISEADALAEGVTDDGSLVTDLAGNDRGGAFAAFATLWEVINGADSWDDNPWVWVVEFRRLT